ncbi:hypothetical protein SUGI_1110220 [Cryptomeria japonica]|nr:hypothetical protein SUGI_1110220 [Cryptomeria japonica]
MVPIWNASGWSAEHAVQRLQDKCLIEVEKSTLMLRHFNVPEYTKMHDHVRDLGRHIANELGPPRLWKQQCLRSMEAKGIKQILAETKGRCFHKFEDSSLGRQITFFIGSLEDSSETDLLWLEFGYKFNDNLNSVEIPSWIPLQKIFCLSASEVEELWSTFQQQLQVNTQDYFELRNLEILRSPSLENLPDLIGKFGLLEELQIVKSLQKTDTTSLVQSLQEISNLRSLCLCEEGASVSGCLNLSKEQLEGLKSLPTFPHLHRLERIKIGASHQLGSTQGLEELRGLKSLEIEVPDNGDASVWNCINGLRELPSEYTILRGKATDTVASRLNGNLFYEWIGAEAIIYEVESNRENYLFMESSSSEISIFCLIIKSEADTYLVGLEPIDTFGYWSKHFLPEEGEWVLTAILSDWEVGLKGGRIVKGFKSSVKKGEEAKALIVLQRIVDRLYRDEMMLTDKSGCFQRLFRSLFCKN